MKRALVSLFLGVGAALLVQQTNSLFLFPAALLVLTLIDPRAWRIFRRWKLWLFFLLVVAIPVLLVAPREAQWQGIPYNPRMLELNLVMIQRSILLMLTIKIFTNRLSPEMLSRALARLRLHHFDQVFSLARSMLPELRTIVSAGLQQVEWRRALRRPSGLISQLGALVARIVYATRRSSSLNCKDGVDETEGSRA